MAEGSTSRKRVRELRCEGSVGGISSSRHGSSSSSSSYSICATTQQEQIPAATLVAAAAAAAATRNPAGNNSNSSSTFLRKGMVILKGFVSEQEQRGLVAHVGRLGEKTNGGFYSCTNEKTKRMKMMNLGLRTDGRKHVLDIPQAWTELATRACRLAARKDPSIPILRPDMCVVNHYTAASRLGWHQDLFSARDPGLPVVSLSLGQPASFLYRVSWKKTAAVKSVTLESGDALVFGGRSRGIIHSVPGIGAASAAATKAASKPAAFSASRKSQALARGVEGKGQGERRENEGGEGGRGGREEGGGREGDGGSGPCVVPDCGRYNLNFREL